MLEEFLHNFLHNLFKPLLLFFYMGFAVPILKVPFEFPKQLYQGLTIYLLIAIGWHGGEELASLSQAGFLEAGGLMVIGFITNTIIGIVAYQFLKYGTTLRRIDAATVAGFYGSDSAGTFVTCLGVLTAANLAYAAYMPVMLAVMEIPGCLVALFLVSQLRRSGMDALGNMPWEEGYIRPALATPSPATTLSEAEEEGELVHSGVQTAEYQMAGHGGSTATVTVGQGGGHRETAGSHNYDHHHDHGQGHAHGVGPAEEGGIFNKAMLHEVFLNPGLYLLFGGILIGFIGRLQGAAVTKVDDSLFVTLFHGMLCLFLLEMGMTACQRLRDLKTAGWRFIVFGLLAPNIFATFGMTVLHLYSMSLGRPFDIGTYALFAVLCGAASYIAVPAVQRLAIPEASPTLPLAASLGLTFSYNVTIGIPVYLLVAKVIMTSFPVGA